MSDMRTYRYVGPPRIAEAARGKTPGRRIVSVDDVRSFTGEEMSESAEPREPDGTFVATFVVDTEGVLRLAPRKP